MSKKKHIIIITGNVGKDAPVARTSQKGTQMATFSVATESALPGPDGKPGTVWFDVVATGKQAEFCLQYIKPGDLLMIEGKLQPARGYIKQDGSAGASMSVWANPMGVAILHSKNAGNGGAGDEFVGEAPEEDELPF